MHHAVDLWRIGIGTANSALLAQAHGLVDDDLHHLTHAALQARGGNLFRHFHETGTARLAHFLGQHAWQIVGGSAFDGAIGKAAGAVDLRLADEVQQVLELFFGLAREAGNEGGANHQFGADLAPLSDAVQVLLARGRALHALQDIGMAVLQRYVEVGQDLAFGHQRQNIVHRGVGIHIVQAHPGAVLLGQIAQLLGQLQHAGLDGLAIPETRAVLDIHAIGRSILADHQQLLDTAFKQRLGFLEHIANRTRHQVATHAGNDAEGAAVVTAFGDLQIRIVLGRELDAGIAKAAGHQIDKRVVRLGQVGVHRVHHLLRGMGAGHSQHAGMHFGHHAAAALFASLGAQATGHDHLAIGGQSLANRVQAFLDGIVDKAAGIDDHQIRAFKGLGGLITLGAELGQDQLGIGQGLGTAQRHEADLGGGRLRGAHRIG